MAVLAGMNKSMSHKKCEYGMDFCINNTLWTTFKDAGYITAYGEDFVNSESYTFSGYHGFNILPTDHYMRPLFLAGETREVNRLCTKKLPSVNHLLDYAFQFLDTYKNEKNFGVFWHNNNIDVHAKFIDDTFVEFFGRLKKSKIFDKTFIIFMSNHGITHGDFKIPVASYYEERLPMLFIWAPYNFRKTFPNKYNNMQKNQDSLVSPYDIFLTLSDVLKFTSSDHAISDPCSNCISLFEEISRNRSCVSASVEEKFCTCHDVDDVDIANGRDALVVAVSYLKEMIKTINTIPFSKCINVQLEKVLRINSYKSFGKKYFIVAFTMTPGNNSYEALLMKDDKSYNILKPVESISGYNTRGSCVIDTDDRPYCVCEMSSPCENLN